MDYSDKQTEPPEAPDGAVAEFVPNDPADADGYDEGTSKAEKARTRRADKPIFAGRPSPELRAAVEMYHRRENLRMAEHYQREAVTEARNIVCQHRARRGTARPGSSRSRGTSRSRRPAGRRTAARSTPSRSPSDEPGPGDEPGPADHHLLEPVRRRRGPGGDSCSAGGGA